MATGAAIGLIGVAAGVGEQVISNATGLIGVASGISNQTFTVTVVATGLLAVVSGSAGNNIAQPVGLLATASVVATQTREAIAAVTGLLGVAEANPSVAYAKNIRVARVVEDNRAKLLPGDSGSTREINSFAIRPLENTAYGEISVNENGTVSLDANLTSISALGTTGDRIAYTTAPDTWAETALTVFMRTLLDDTTGAAALITLNAQPNHPGLTSIASVSMGTNSILVGSGTDAYTKVTMSPFFQTLVGDTTASSALSTLGGQTSNANLTALALVTIATDEMIYGLSDSTWRTTALTSAARELLDDASASAMRTTLGLGTIALLNSIANSNLANMANATVKGRTSTGSGVPEDVTMTQLRAMLKPVLRCPFHAYATGTAQLGTHPSTAQFLLNASQNIQLADLANYSQCRIFHRTITNSASTNTPRLIARYVTSYTSTVASWLDIGTSEVSSSLASYGVQNSGWMDLAAGAKADDVYISIIQIGGDGTATPRVASVFIEFR